MKKSEIVLLWVAGLWAVVCLLAIASEGRWASYLAMILAGWLVCGLVWLSVNKWPKGKAEGSGVGAKLRVVFQRAAGRFPGVVVSGLGYVLALVFLLAWTNVRAHINKERLAVGQIATGYFELSDCHALPASQANRCVVKLLQFTPVSSEGNAFEQVAREMMQRCFLTRDILAPEKGQVPAHDLPVELLPVPSGK